MTELKPWVIAILAHPVTKQPCKPESFNNVNGIIDTRVFLKNTHGYSEWAEGQDEYENDANKGNISLAEYQSEIEGTRPVYQYYKLTGRILDCGGGAGTVREYLSDEVEFVSTDPWLQAPFASSPARKAAYTCLNRPLNFIAATAEFQPFVEESFDWVHMRSMLDHVQVTDLALLEAKRILKPGGHVLIGLYVDGGKSGVISFERRIKDSIKAVLGFIGIERWKDHHIWHPTYKNLLKLITDNGFEIEDTYWQPQWKDMVCYVCARKPR
jgi:ubiquinone/menaquinone biosynthesis C-methylase UbiE